MTEAEKELALNIVKDTLKLYLTKREYLPSPANLPELFTQEGASFVTFNLKKDNSLRGCMGTILAHKPLVEDLIKNTISSATGDPRFDPMTESDLETVSIEISVLSKPKPLEYSGCDDLLSKIREGVDGVIIRQSYHQATFLPSVWEQLPSKEEFLANLCHKAGLEVDCYKARDLKVYTYQAEKIIEEMR